MKIVRVSFEQRLRGGGWTLAALVIATLVFAIGSAAAETPQRYPYDPVCMWGRLADGHGMLMRCLTPEEASQLLQAPLPNKTAPASSAKEPNAQKVYVSKVSPAIADTGELPLAAKKLSVPADRYASCVTNNGGLSASPATVVVRFLVRERGRAEGVAVKTFSGMNEAAAKCIADVVDRRYVGYPAAPVVGATVHIELSTKR